MSTDAPARATLSEIAADAAVSISTVSKVLNGRPDVSAATRERVEALLADRGYARRNGAESPRSPLIEVVFHELEASWSMEIIAGVDEVARRHGLSVVLSESGSRHAPGPEWVTGMLRRRPTGVVLVCADLPAGYRSQLDTRGIPFAIVDPAGDPAPDIPSVGSANWAGGLAATRHLIELGHTRIAVITGPDDMMCSRAREGGYRAAMDAAGLRVQPGWVQAGDFYTHGGHRIGTRLLELDTPPTAIFAGSDLQALGVYEAARERGVRIPEDLSVVGYDDIPLARWVSPQLTSVHQPLRRMGAEAARIVVAAAHDGGMPEITPRVDLATHLVVRASTAAPPGT